MKEQVPCPMCLGTGKATRGSWWTHLWGCPGCGGDGKVIIITLSAASATVPSDE